MGTPKLAPGKRRYSVSLTESVVNRFQALCHDFGMPPVTMSNVCNDALHEVSELFATAKSQGKFDLDDIFRLMGKQVQLLMDEERRESEALHKKRDSAAG